MSRFARALVSLLLVVAATPASADSAASGALESATHLPSAHPPTAQADAAYSAHPASPAPATPFAGKELESKPATPPVAVAKSGAAALALSILVPAGTGVLGFAMAQTRGPASAAGMVLILGAVTVGPAAGHLYTGEIGRAVDTSLGRTLAAGLFVDGVLNTADLCFHSPCPPDDDDTPGTVLAVLGGGAWTALTMFDVIDSPASARRANAKAAPRLALSPVLLHIRGRDLQPARLPGLQLAGSF